MSTGGPKVNMDLLLSSSFHTRSIGHPSPNSTVQFLVTITRNATNSTWANFFPAGYPQSVENIPIHVLAPSENAQKAPRVGNLMSPSFSHPRVLPRLRGCALDFRPSNREGLNVLMSSPQYCVFRCKFTVSYAIIEPSGI